MGAAERTPTYGPFDPERAAPPQERCSSCGRLRTAVLRSWPSWATEDAHCIDSPGCLVCDRPLPVVHVWHLDAWHSVEADLVRERTLTGSRAGALVDALLAIMDADTEPETPRADPILARRLWDDVLDAGVGFNLLVPVWLLAVRHPDLGVRDARRYAAAHEHATGWENVPVPLPPMATMGHEGERLTMARAELRSLLRDEVPWVAPDGSGHRPDGLRWRAIGRAEGVSLGAGPLAGVDIWWLVRHDPTEPPEPCTHYPAPSAEADSQLRDYLRETDPFVHEAAADAWRAVSRSSSPEGDDLIPASLVRQSLGALAAAEAGLRQALAAPDVRTLRAEAVGRWQDPLFTRSADPTLDPSWTVLPPRSRALDDRRRRGRLLRRR